jgi:membrane fusion protein, multidrug efflux system
MNKTILFSFLVITLFIVSCDTQDPGTKSDIAIPVSVEEVTKKPIREYVSTTGTVYATKETMLKTEIAGEYYLQNSPNTGKPFKLGDKVLKGQVIIRIEDEEYENNIKIEAQKLTLDNSKREYEKQKSLYDKGGVTLSEVSNAERQYLDAQYAWENAKINLEKMNIRAPISGIITKLPHHTQGTRIQAGQDVVKIMNYNTLFLEIELPEKEMDKVRTGQKAEITNYSNPGSVFYGEITELSPAIEPGTRTFSGKLIIENQELKLRPGMFVKSDIVVAQKDSALVIPKDIILSNQRGKVVYVVERQTAWIRVLSFGLENPDEVEVTEGLEEKERIVVKGFETLSNRSKVKIIK